MRSRSLEVPCQSRAITSVLWVYGKAGDTGHVLDHFRPANRAPDRLHQTRMRERREIAKAQRALARRIAERHTVDQEEL